MGDHGDAGAIRSYASKLRNAGKRLQTISDDADANVYFYSDGWQGQFQTDLRNTWNVNFTATDQLHDQALSDERTAFVKANPRLARLYDANSSSGPSGFRQLIDACNAFADWLDNYATYIDKANAADNTSFWVDIGIGVVAFVATAVTLGADAEITIPAAIGLAGLISGTTAVVMDGTNQIIDNMMIKGDSFGQAWGDMNWGEVALSFGIGFVVGGITVIGGMGISSLVTGAAGRIFTTGVTSTFARTAIGMFSFATAAAVTDSGTQLVLDHFTGQQFSWSQVALAGGFGALGGGIVTEDVSPGGDRVIDFTNTGTTVDVNGPGGRFTALTNSSGDGTLTIFNDNGVVGTGTISPDGTTIDVVPKNGGDPFSVSLQAGQVDVTNGAAGFKMQDGQITQVFNSSDAPQQMAGVVLGGDQSGGTTPLAPQTSGADPVLLAQQPGPSVTTTGGDGGPGQSAPLVTSDAAAGPNVTPSVPETSGTASLVNGTIQTSSGETLDLGSMRAIGGGRLTEVNVTQGPDGPVVKVSIESTGGLNIGDGVVVPKGDTAILGSDGSRSIYDPSTGRTFDINDITGNTSGDFARAFVNNQPGVSWSADTPTGGDRAFADVPQSVVNEALNGPAAPTTGGGDTPTFSGDRPWSDVPEAIRNQALNGPGSPTSGGGDTPRFSGDRPWSDVPQSVRNEALSGPASPTSNGGGSPNLSGDRPWSDVPQSVRDQAVGGPPSSEPAGGSGPANPFQFSPEKGGGPQPQVEAQGSVLVQTATPPAEIGTGVDIDTQTIQDPTTGRLFTVDGPVASPTAEPLPSAAPLAEPDTGSLTIAPAAGETIAPTGIEAGGTTMPAPTPERLAPPVAAAPAPIDTAPPSVTGIASTGGVAMGAVRPFPFHGPTVTPVPAPQVVPLQVPPPNAPEVTPPQTWVPQPIPLRVPLPNVPEVTPPRTTVPGPVPVEVPPPFGSPGPRPQPVPVPGKPGTQPPPIPGTQPPPIPGTQPPPIPGTEPPPAPGRQPAPGPQPPPGARPGPGPQPGPGTRPVPIPGTPPGVFPPPEFQPPPGFQQPPPPEEFPLTRPNEFPGLGGVPEVVNPQTWIPEIPFEVPIRPPAQPGRPPIIVVDPTLPPEAPGSGSGEPPPAPRWPAGVPQIVASAAESPAGPATAEPPAQPPAQPEPAQQVVAPSAQPEQQPAPAPGEEPQGDRATAYRAQGRPLIHVDENGNVAIDRPQGRHRQGVAVHIGFDAERAQFWLTDMEGRDEVVQFDVEQWFLEKLRATAQPEHGVERDRTKPWRVDLHTRGRPWKDQFAIPPAMLDELESAIIQGTGRVWHVGDDPSTGGGPAPAPKPTPPAGGPGAGASPTVAPDQMVVPPAEDAQAPQPDHEQTEAQAQQAPEPPHPFPALERPEKIQNNPFDPEPSRSYELALLRMQYEAEAVEALRTFHKAERNDLLARYGRRLATTPVEQVPAVRQEQSEEWASLVQRQRSDWSQWAGRHVNESGEAATRRWIVDTAAALRAMGPEAREQAMRANPLLRLVEGMTPTATQVIASVMDVGEEMIDASGSPTGAVMGVPVRFDVIVHPAGVRTPPITEVVFRLSWLPDADVSAEDIARVQRETLESVDHFFNAPRYTLPDGSELRVTTVFTVAGDARLYTTVRLHRTMPRQNATDWSVEGSPFDARAHELGHWLGLKDEYFDTDPTKRTRPRATPQAPGVRYDGSLYGMPVGIPMSLKPRHIQQIGDLIARLRYEVPATELTDGAVRYRRDPDPFEPHVGRADAALRQLIESSERVLRGEVPVTADMVAAGRAVVDQTANILKIWLDRRAPASGAEVEAAQRRLAAVPDLQARLRAFEAGLREPELDPTLHEWEEWAIALRPGEPSLADMHTRTVAAEAARVTEATRALRQAIAEGQAAEEVRALARALEAEVRALDHALETGSTAANVMRGIQQRLANQVYRLAALGRPMDRLERRRRSRVDRAFRSDRIVRMDEALRRFDHDLTTAGKLLADLGFSTATAPAPGPNQAGPGPRAQAPGATPSGLRTTPLSTLSPNAPQQSELSRPYGEVDPELRAMAGKGGVPRPSPVLPDHSPVGIPGALLQQLGLPPATVQDVFANAAAVAAQALLHGQGQRVVKGVDFDVPETGESDLLGGYQPADQRVHLRPSVWTAFEMAIAARAQNRQLTPDEVRDLKEAARTLLHEFLHGTYPDDPARLQMDEGAYRARGDRNIEEGQTDWLAQARVAEFLHLMGLDAIAPGLDGAPITQGYSARVAMVRAFAEMGGMLLLGFRDLNAYRDAMALQIAETRMDWMVDRIIHTEGLPNDDAVRQEVRDAIIDAFNFKLQPGPNQDREGWQAGLGAFRSLERRMKLIRQRYS